MPDSIPEEVPEEVPEGGILEVVLGSPEDSAPE